MLAFRAREIRGVRETQAEVHHFPLGALGPADGGGLFAGLLSAGCSATPVPDFDFLQVATSCCSTSTALSSCGSIPLAS